MKGLARRILHVTCIGRERGKSFLLLRGKRIVEAEKRQKGGGHLPTLLLLGERLWKLYSDNSSPNPMKRGGGGEWKGAGKSENPRPCIRPKASKKIFFGEAKKPQLLFPSRQSPISASTHSSDLTARAIR